MTAVVTLPPGWVHMYDLQRNLYYQNNITRETTRVHPANLPPGWTELKDPDGKTFFVNHDLHLASWCRPGQQPLLAASTAAVESAIISNNRPARPALAGNSATCNIRPQTKVMVPEPNAQGHRRVAGPQPGQQQVSLATATEATINLLDPSNGGIVRNTKIVSHIAGQGVKGTVKAVAQNQRLQTFARGTGLAMANKKVKKAWRKAAKEVASLDGYRKQEIRVTQTGPQGKIAVQAMDASFDGEYVIEYEDGTVEYYDAKERLLRTSTIGSQHPPQPNPGLLHRPANQQRPPLHVQSQPVQAQQLLLRPAQQPTKIGQMQLQQGPTQQGQIQHNQTVQPPQQGTLQQFQGQPQAMQKQTYQSQLQQSVQGQLQQVVQSQLQTSQPQQWQISQVQSQSQAQQKQSFMSQLQQAAQEQVQQAVQHQLAQTQPTQAPQSQSQSQSQTQQTQSVLQQQQAQDHQMQQLLQQSKLQAQQNFNQQLQQRLQQQQQQMASTPAHKDQYEQNQPSLLDQAVSVLQQTENLFVDQVPTQTVYMDQTPAQAIYIDQAPAETLFVDRSAAQQTIYTDQTAHSQDRALYTDSAAGDMNLEINIEQNVYVDQNYQDQSYVVQEETFVAEDGDCDQVYELQDDGCVDGGYEVDSGDCGDFEDAGFDF